MLNRLALKEVKRRITRVSTDLVTSHVPFMDLLSDGNEAEEKYFANKNEKYKKWYYEWKELKTLEEKLIEIDRGKR